MLDDGKRAEFDQTIALLAEIYPNQWRRMYLGLVKEGFTESEAMELLKSYITASCSINT